jgi:aminopeptidase
MTDPRYTKLANLLVKYSTALKKGERVLVEATDAPDEFSVELMRAIRRAGAIPLIEVRHTRITREVMRETDHSHATLVRDVELFRMKKVQAYMAIRGSANASEAADVESKRMALYARILRPVLNHRINKTRWVVLRWPTPSMAQAASMSTEAFEDYFFRVCTLDYSRMIPGMTALKELMDKTDRVQLKGPGTDLFFSIKGIGSVTCGGDRNIPDGEVFSCPVRDSVEGHLTFNAPTIYQGTAFDNIRLDFEKGRIVAATAIMALVLTFAKPLLPISIVSFGVLAATGCLVYVAAAVAFDIAGLRKAVIAYAARRNLPAPSITAPSTGLPSMSAREP